MHATDYMDKDNKILRTNPDIVQVLKRIEDGKQIVSQFIKDTCHFAKKLRKADQYSEQLESDLMHVLQIAQEMEQNFKNGEDYEMYEFSL